MPETGAMATSEAHITGLNDNGEGTFVDSLGRLVSIPGALEGETIRYRLEHVSPHGERAWGRCEALLKPSTERCEAPCALSWPTRGACGGCPLMHMRQELQNEYKKKLVMDALKRIGIHYIHQLPLICGEKRLRYRNRTDLVIAQNRGRIYCGAYEPRSHRVIAIPHCPVLRSPLNQVISAFDKTIHRLKLPVFSSMPNPGGALRYASFYANGDNEVLIDIVCQSARTETPAWLGTLTETLQSFKPVRGISYSLNDSPNNAIRIQDSTRLWGLDTLQERHGDIMTHYTAAGFTQLNTEIATKIYTTARTWLDTHPGVVWDLYCGTGPFGRTLRPRSALFGAEFNARAVASAKRSANDDPWQSHYEVLDLEKNWPQTWPKPDIIVVNPPRKGLSNLILEQLLAMRGVDVLYMSCNPDSFARNVALLSPQYVLASISAFDMMPQTRHVEILGYLRAQ